MSREMWIVAGVVVAVIAVVTLFFAFKLGARLFATRRMLGELGAGGKVAFYGSLLYAFFPLDLLPDPIYLDDIGVLAAALAILTNMLRKRRGARHAQQMPAPRDPRADQHSLPK